MIEADADSENERKFMTEVRIAAARALAANEVPYEFGRSNEDEGPAAACNGQYKTETTNLPMLEKFAGQVLTRETFLAIYVKEKAKGQTASVQLATEDENCFFPKKARALGVLSRLAVGCGFPAPRVPRRRRLVPPPSWIGSPWRLKNKFPFNKLS